MTQITIACGSCRTQMTVDARLSGQTVQCQACGGLCELPQARPAVIVDRDRDQLFDLLRAIIHNQKEIDRQVAWSARWGCLIAGLAAVAVLILLSGVAVHLR